MAEFYASIQGNRGERTCMGTKSSGIESHTRDWNVGARVTVSYDEKLKTNVVEVFITGGSNNPSSIKRLLKLTKEDVKLCSK